MRSTLLLLAALAGLASWATPVGAQAVIGQVVDEATAQPVAGAFVVLIHSSGARRGAVLADATGHFYLRAPSPGSYTVRVEQIGYRSATTPALTLEAGASVTRRIELTVRPVRLEEINASGSRRCRIPRDVGAQTYRLWEEARKALAVAAWVERDRGVPYQTLEYERTRNLLSLEIQEQKARLRSGFGRRAFRSIRADDLARNGYVRLLAGGAHRYFGPDAATLLSDPFLDTHCFRVREPPRGERELIGLGFEPLPTQLVPDIEGVLWLDRATLELRTLEFTFTGHLQPVRVPSEPFGGRVEFRRLANGAWVVDRWRLRMPQLPDGGAPALRITDGPAGGTGRDELLDAHRLGMRIREEGGALRYMAEPGPLDRGTAVVQGTVYDSIRGVPLAGATVFLESARRSTITDSAGRFRLDDVPDGRQKVGFLHPYADSLGLAVRPRLLILNPDERATIELFIPSGSACARDAAEGQGAVAGVVYDASDGAPVEAATVSVEWRSRGTTGRGFNGPMRERTVRTGPDGRYLLCGFLLHQEVRLTARHPKGRAEVEFEGAPLVLQDLLIH